MFIYATVKANYQFHTSIKVTQVVFDDKILCIKFQNNKLARDF